MSSQKKINIRENVKSSEQIEVATMTVMKWVEDCNDGDQQPTG